jgi:hypothetical protein
VLEQCDEQLGAIVLAVGLEQERRRRQVGPVGKVLGAL